MTTRRFRTSRARRAGVAALAAVAVAATTAVAGPTAAQAAGTCSTRWGSLPESGNAQVTSPLVGVRAGRHACYDRLVLDVAGDARGAYRVEYVPVVRQDGSGFAVPLRGAGDIRLLLRAPAHDENGRLTVPFSNRRELVNVTGWRTFRQVAFAGSFEGQTTIGLGVRARLPFRVFVLPGPGPRSRVVVDVAHRW